MRIGNHRASRPLNAVHRHKEWFGFGRKMISDKDVRLSSFDILKDVLFRWPFLSLPSFIVKHTLFLVP